MKTCRFAALFLVICLLCLLCCCSRDSASSPAEEDAAALTPGSSQEQTAFPAQPDAPEQPDVPQADEELVQEAVLNFGATQSNGALQTKVLSLYYHDRWTIDEADGNDFFSWFSSAELYTDEQKEQLFSSDLPEACGYAYPADLYEADVLRFFDATTEQMRSNPSLYHADSNTYYALSGPGVGERPWITLQSFQQEGELVNIDLFLDGETEPDRQMVLTIRLTDDGYRYVSYLPQTALRSISDQFLEEILLKFGAQVSTNPDAESPYTSTATGLFLLESWKVEACTPEDIAWWYLDYANRTYTYSERAALFASPLGEDTGWFYPADLYEAAAQAYFGVAPYDLRTDNEYYSEQYGGYFSPFVAGRGYCPSITLEGYDRQYDLLILHLSVSRLNGSPRAMDLTVRLDDNHYQYLSYLPQ